MAASWLLHLCSWASHANSLTPGLLSVSLRQGEDCLVCWSSPTKALTFLPRFLPFKANTFLLGLSFSKSYFPPLPHAAHPWGTQGRATLLRLPSLVGRPCGGCFFTGNGCISVIICSRASYMPRHIPPLPAAYFTLSQESVNQAQRSMSSPKERKSLL